jgi:hypothetical protein
MQTISEEIIERTAGKLAAMSINDMPKLLEKMEKEQPEIMAFLMAIDHDVLNQDERELLFYLGMVVWQMMREGTPRPKRVSAERLDELVVSTAKIVESFMNESPGDFMAVMARMFKDHHQINVLRYIVEALFELEADGEHTEAREEMKGVVFKNLKIVLEALDQ